LVQLASEVREVKSQAGFFDQGHIKYACVVGDAKISGLTEEVAGDKFLRAVDAVERVKSTNRIIAHAGEPSLADDPGCPRIASLTSRHGASLNGTEI